jgi:kinetochore protein NDC80
MHLYSYQEQIERVDRLKDETIRNIVKSSSDIAAFREEVSNHLMSLRRCAEQRAD